MPMTAWSLPAERWTPPSSDLDPSAATSWPDSIFVNPFKRRGPLLNARFVSLVIACFDVFADDDEERTIAYARLVDAARHFDVPLDARCWSDLTRAGRQQV
jgi:hypothetical protein